MDKDIEIIKYNPSLKKAWDEYVENSKNGNFLLRRDYMDYHSHRFKDFSLLFFLKGKLYTLLPANITEETVYSHQGLTYGGFVMDRKCTAEGILAVFSVLMTFLKENGIKKLIYKPVPYIYSVVPSEEDLYALFRHNAELKVRNISSTIARDARLNFSTLRKRMIKKAEGNDIHVSPSEDYSVFWDILEKNLMERHKVRPVHSLEEITRLHSLFPENIKLFCATKDRETIAGVLCYESKNVVHCQYISANTLGRETGGLDMIFTYLIDNHYSHIPYFDFGISNEDGGRYLNESLIHQKEGFGARGVCYDTYELKIQ